MRKAILVFAEVGLGSAFWVWLDRQQWVTDGQLLGLAAIFAVVIAATLIWPKRQKSEPTDDTIVTWAEIEGRFKDLQQRDWTHPDRSDGILGATQDETSTGQLAWRIRGSSKALREEANRLCGLAGRRLSSTKGVLDSPRILRATGDVDRWLSFLIDIGEVKAQDRPYVSGDFGGRHQTKYHYNINDLMKSSIAGCLECLRREL